MSKYRVIFYAIVFFLIFQFEIIIRDSFLTIIFLIGELALVLSWILWNKKYHSKEYLSKFSEIEKTYELNNKWYSHLLVPMLFTFCLHYYVIIVNSLVLVEFLIFVSSIVYYAYLKVIFKVNPSAFHIDSHLGLIIDFMSTIVFFIVASIFTYLGIESINWLWIVFPLYTVITLIGSAIFYKKLHVQSYILAFVAGVIVGLAYFVLYTDSIFRFPIILTLTYYLLLSFWYLMLNGEKRVSEYLTPFLLVIMSILILLR